MSDKLMIVIEMAIAAVWTWFVFTRLPEWITIADGPLIEGVMRAFLLPGLVLAAMVMTVGLHRFIGNDAAEGGRFHGPRAQINQRVLINSTEQTVLAFAIWPGAALAIGEKGAGVLAAMGVSFVLARLLFWAGYHIRPPLRALGFAATFYPTVAFGIWGAIAMFGA